MKWMVALAVFLVLATSALAEGADEEYLDIYNEILQGDNLQESGHNKEAAARYVQAQSDLLKLQSEHPKWNVDIVKYRLGYLADKLDELKKAVPAPKPPATNVPPPATNPPSTVAPAPAPEATPVPSAPQVQTPVPSEPAPNPLAQQVAASQEQIRSLTAANAELEAKLKEALSVQPATVSPAELTKAQAKITALQKEKALLEVDLDQAKAANASAVSTASAAAIEKQTASLKARAEADVKKAQDEAARARQAAADSEAKLVAATKELETLKAARASEDQQSAAFKAQVEAESKKAQDEIAQLKQAAADSEAKLAAESKELELLKAAREKEAAENAEIKAQAEADRKRSQEEMARLKEAAAESGKMLAAITKELELLRGPHVEEAAPPHEGPPLTSEERQKLNMQVVVISKDEAEIVQLKDAVAEAEKKLARANSELDSLKAVRAVETAPVPAGPPETARDVIEERDRLKEELAERSKDLADAEANRNREIISLRAALKQAQQRRDQLEKMAGGGAKEQPIAAAVSTPAENPVLTHQLEQLQARVAVLEANPVPYTTEELAAIKEAPPAKHVELPRTTAPSKPRHVYSNADLPPGAVALWSDAMRDSMEGNYSGAEQKFTDVLHQDENNVYVLAHLADAQFAEGKLAECEKTVKRALVIDPNDAGSLYLLGLLRYRQERLDEALDALSRVAKLDPTNATAQNFLGCVLAEKGLRPAAETALRTALQYDPDSADAHFNLAVIYAGNKPPSIELARWHYKRAISLGHAKSATVEKTLGDIQ